MRTALSCLERPGDFRRCGEKLCREDAGDARPDRLPVDRESRGRHDRLPVDREESRGAGGLEPGTEAKDSESSSPPEPFHTGPIPGKLPIDVDVELIRKPSGKKGPAPDLVRNRVGLGSGGFGLLPPLFGVSENDIT